MKIRGFIVATAVFAFAACSKEKPITPSSDRDCIAFSVGESSISTKVGVTNENLSTSATIITRGTESSAAIDFAGSTDLKLQFDNDAGYWFPNGRRDWKSWKAAGYSFTTYAYSPKGSTSVTISGAPTTVNITEPQTYRYGSEDADFVDYLLSYRHDITNGITRPIVTMKLEHALCDVEIYVVKDPSIEAVTVKSMSVTGFYRQARMVCTQAQYVTNGTQPKNQWSATLSGVNTNTYSWTDNTGKVAADTYTESAAYMKFIAIPQSVGNVTLNVDLDINQKDEEGDKWVNHPYTNMKFNLAGLPRDWVSGNKYIYILTVDTGIHLTGYIVEWKNGGSIETTILPEITEDTGE